MGESCYPPSAELIPDEYEVYLDGRECVHIFVDRSFVEKCEEFLKALNIKLPGKCIHKLDSRNNVLHTLNNVARTPQKDKSLLLLIFWGFFSLFPYPHGHFTLDDSEQLFFYEIWSEFCNGHWRNTPKVFLLNVIKSEDTIVRDSFIYRPLEFETPNEGDVLIVLKKNINPEESESFIEELKKTIDKLGQKEDFSSIVTAVEVVKSRPILISTMLRKLFLIPSKHRGHHFTLTSNNEDILREMEKIRRLLEMGFSFRIEQSRVETTDYMSSGRIEQIDSADTRRSSKSRPETDNLLPRKSTDKCSRQISSSKSVRRKSSTTKREPWR